MTNIWFSEDERSIMEKSLDYIPSKMSVVSNI